VKKGIEGKKPDRHQYAKKEESEAVLRGWEGVRAEGKVLGAPAFLILVTVGREETTSRKVGEYLNGEQTPVEIRHERVVWWSCKFGVKERNLRGSQVETFQKSQAMGGGKPGHRAGKYFSEDLR